MKKNEIKKAENHELVYDLVESYGNLVLNINLGLGTGRLAQHCCDLQNEMVARGLLTERENEMLNS